MDQGTSTSTTKIAGSSASAAQFRYFPYVMAAFVAILLLSNIIGASKPSYVVLPNGAQWAFGAGVLFFPISYIIGDVLTEVYGYANARRVIWTGFAALLFMAFMAWVVVALPPAEGWPGQEAYEFVFGNSWRIVLASMVAFWVGEFANSFVMAKMKVWTRGKLLWSRTIGSTVVGQGLDSLIFYPLAFYGLAGWPIGQLWQVVLSQWLIKVGVGSAADAGHLSGGQFPQAPRRGGSVRYRHRLLPLRRELAAEVGAGLLLGQQPHREVDDDKAAEPGNRSDREDQPDNQRIHVEVVGNPGANTCQLAVGLVEAEADGAAAARSAKIVHARIPATVVAVGWAKLETSSVMVMASAPKAARILLATDSVFIAWYSL